MIDFKSTYRTLPPLAKQARMAMDNFGPQARLRRLPNVMLDGAPAYHIAGTIPSHGPYEEVGADSHDRAMAVSFTLQATPPKERREIVDSVIASFKWKK